jgi:citrate lyase subunit beta/citryl-CoA lyase
MTDTETTHGDTSSAETTKDIGRGTLRLRRSVLIAPGDNATMLGKMAGSLADVCIVDWEDGVLPSRKEAARGVSTDALGGEWRCLERVVRVNGPDTPWYRDDLAAAVATGCDSIMIPKAESGADVEEADRLITAAERACGRPVGSVLVWVLVETVHAVLDLESVAKGPRMTAMIFGAGDLGADLRLRRINLGAGRLLGPVRHEYAYAMGRFVAAARAGGIDPVSPGFSTYRDLDGTKEEAEISAQFGFAGSLAISPRQIPTLNATYRPSADDMRWADEVLATTDAAEAEDSAVTVVDGGMIDGPFVRNARFLRELDRLAAERDEAALAVAT